MTGDGNELIEWGSGCELPRTMSDTTIREFTDLEAWKKSHAVVLLTYRYTKQFPREEMFGLTNQMRRAAVSAESNIA